MGLTIHWDLSADSNMGIRELTGLVNQIRQRAASLPFAHVGEVFSLQGDECNLDKQDRNQLDENRIWLLTGVCTFVDVGIGRGYASQLQVNPKQIIGFNIDVGDGSESMDIYFAQYPKTVTHNGKRYRVNKKGWGGHGFCKTQYASSPECGGVVNFLRCHVSAVTLLEFAQSLPGLHVYINDEGKYGTSNYTDDWTVPEPVYYDHPATHDIEALAKEVGEWNEMIAAGAGALKDLLSKDGSGMVVHSAIDAFPDREHLEAKGVADNPQIRTNLGLTV